MAIVLSAKQFGFVVVALQLVVFITVVYFLPASEAVQVGHVHTEECHMNIETVLLNLDELLGVVRDMARPIEYQTFCLEKEAYDAKLKDMEHGVRIMIEHALSVASANCLPHH